MQTFDDLMDLSRADAGWRAHISADWMQGRGSFGGLTAALAIRALRHDLGDARPLVSLDIAFIGPAGGDVDITTETLRKGRNVTHAAAEIRSEGNPVVRAHAVYGVARPTGITVAAPLANPSGARDSVEPWPHLPGIMPTFTQHFEFRATEGDVPFSGSSRATMGGYVRFVSTPSSELTTETLVALVDAWPGPMLPLGERPFPASSVRMSVQVVGAPPADFEDDYWFHSECIAAESGYATIVGRLYAGETLVLWMEQLVAYFDA